MKFVARSLALLAVVLAPAAALDAQSISSPYRFIEKGQEAGVFAGYFSAGDDRFQLGPRSAPIFGVRYAVTVSGALALEGLISTAPTTRWVINPNRLEGDRIIDEAEAALTFFEARIRFNLTGRRTWNGIQPFSLIGVGLAWDAAGAQAEDAVLAEEFRYDFGTDFTGSFGGGVRWMLGDRFHLRADLVAQLYQIDTPDGYRSGDIDLGAAVAESQWVTSPVLTAGLAFRF